MERFRISTKFIRLNETLICNHDIFPQTICIHDPQIMGFKIKKKPSIPNELLEFSNANTNPIVLLLVGIITNDNKKFISEEEFRKVYDRSNNYSNIEEFIQWERSLLQELLLEILDHPKDSNKKNILTIEQVMQQM